MEAEDRARTHRELCRVWETQIGSKACRPEFDINDPERLRNYDVMAQEYGPSSAVIDPDDAVTLAKRKKMQAEQLRILNEQVQEHRELKVEGRVDTPTAMMRALWAVD